MGLPNVMNTGRSAMVAAKTAIATSGHNIANSNTEGYSRQRVQTAAETPRSALGNNGFVGTGTRVARIERLNDEYIEKQLRTVGRDVANGEEKELALRQAEDIFNEMNGDGLNRLISRFFNEFRKLSNEPDNEAVRQSVREASQAMVNDFHRIRKEVDEVRRHLDSRIEGYTAEVNILANEIKELNVKIVAMSAAGGAPNDLLDKRDIALKRLASYMDLTTHTDKQGAYVVEVRGVGPLVSGPLAEKFDVLRTPANDQGKPEGAVDVHTSASAAPTVTNAVKGGKIGALLEVRDKTLSRVLDRMDELAFAMSESVNAIHNQGFTRDGVQGVDYFKRLASKDRAAEFIGLSDALSHSVNNIATAAEPDSPGDNRVAIAISGIQHTRLMNEGKTTMDDFYNSIISDIGVVAAHNRSTINQHKDIQNQLGKIREQISGVSIDEETTNLMQFQHTFDASAKVIQIADELLETVLNLRR